MLSRVWKPQTEITDVRIAVARGSLTEGSETLLVNASNTNVQLGTGVSAAIRAACGAGYQEHIREELGKRHGGPMSPGQVLVTDAGAHPRAKWVAHVAVMDYRDGFTSRVREPTRIACDALRAYRGAKVAGCTFYGYALHEYAAVADVVCAAFPEVMETVPPEVRALFAAKE